MAENFDEYEVGNEGLVATCLEELQAEGMECASVELLLRMAKEGEQDEVADGEACASCESCARCGLACVHIRGAHAIPSCMEMLTMLTIRHRARSPRLHRAEGEPGGAVGR